MKHVGQRRGFTIKELVASVVTISTIFFAARHPAGTGTAQTRRAQCQNNVRTVVQAMQAFADNNQGSYPLPSRLDLTGTTIGPAGAATNSQLEAKNNLGNVLSILIFNNAITPEMCVSPAEVSGVVHIDQGYQHANPQRAAAAGGNPATALWDPGFAATPTTSEPFYRRTPGISNSSYASTVFFGARRQVWSNTHNATEPVFGNRGPKYAGTDSGDRAGWNGFGSNGWPLANGMLGSGSNTLRIHGSPQSWEGNIGYNDGHVTYERRPDPAEALYQRYGNPSTTPPVPDNLFVDESDDATAGTSFDPALRRNAWLRPVASVQASGTTTTINLWLD
ncbi:MAG: type II secretion system protein [Phycisphaerales bacterium]